MSIEKDVLGAAIKRVRIARGLTQVELAEAAGLSKGGKSIALIEQGKRFVSVATLNELAKALDLPPACLAILGSRSTGKNKAAAEFMKSLQHLISTVILSEEQLRTGETTERSKQDAVDAQRKHLARVAAKLRVVSVRRRTGSKSMGGHAAKTSRRKSTKELAS